MTTLHDGAASGTLELGVSTSGWAAGVYQFVVTARDIRVSRPFTAAR